MLTRGTEKVLIVSLRLASFSRVEISLSPMSLADSVVFDGEAGNCAEASVDDTEASGHVGIVGTLLSVVCS